jgi:hypothetical protein
MDSINTVPNTSAQGLAVDHAQIEPPQQNPETIGVLASGSTSTRPSLRQQDID